MFIIVHFQKRRTEALREKLAKLSDEEKLEFLRIKAELQAKKKGAKNNDTIP